MSVVPDELNLRRQARTPVIRAAEAAECGLACLAMIAGRHGQAITLNGLRQRFPASLQGLTVKDLIGIAAPLGLAGRALRLEVDDLSKLRLPAVLHWNLNHFVVLTAVTRHSAVIHDPARGRREITPRDLDGSFTGVAIEFWPIGDFQTEPALAAPKVRLDSLWSKLSGFWSSFALVLLLSAALQVFAFALPFQVQLVVDEGILHSDRDLLLVLALGFGAIVVLQGAVETLRSGAVNVFGHLMAYQMTGNVVRHLFKLPTSFFEKRHVGDILSRITSVAAIQDTLTKGAVSAIIDGFMALFAVILLFVYSPLLAGIVLATVALNLTIALSILPTMRARTEEKIAAAAREQSHMVETLRGATTLRVMGGEAQRENEWRRLYADVVNAGVSIGRFQVGLGASQLTIGGLQTVLILYYGALAVIAGDGFSVGMLYAFLSFRQTFTDRTNALVNQLLQFRFLSLHLERVADIVTTRTEAGFTAVEAAPTGDIALREVSFRYGEGGRTILRDIDLEIHDGEFVAFIGPSGQGKSTLMKLLLGLATPSVGQVAIGGQPMTSESWRAWRKTVGFVAQDDRLFSGTLAENIAFFDDDLSMDRVLAAAEQACIHNDIDQMPMGYETLVGDMGAALSGGQRQRILLARALYRQPRILILDEGTANLDEETELDVVDLIAGFSGTRIVVAHRPALVARADRVLIVRDGAVTQQRREAAHRDIERVTA